MENDCILAIDLLNEVYNKSNLNLVGKKYITVLEQNQRAYYTEKTEYTVKNVNKRHNTLIITCNCMYDESLGYDIDLLKTDCIFLRRFLESKLKELD